jgi:hypothetical protein
MPFLKSSDLKTYKPHFNHPKRKSDHHHTALNSLIILIITWRSGILCKVQIVCCEGGVDRSCTKNCDKVIIGLSFGIVPRDHDLSSGGATSNEEQLTQQATNPSPLLVILSSLMQGNRICLYSQAIEPSDNYRWLVCTTTIAARH